VGGLLLSGYEITLQREVRYVATETNVLIHIEREVSDDAKGGVAVKERKLVVQDNVDAGGEREICYVSHSKAGGGCANCTRLNTYSST
jgi:hypothetical protein